MPSGALRGSSLIDFRTDPTIRALTLAALGSAVASATGDLDSPARGPAPATAPPATAPASPPPAAPPPAAPAPPARVALQPPLAQPASGPGLGGVWACIRAKESGGDYAAHTGNGYYGAYQFSEATWRSIGGLGFPDQAPPALQDAMAQRLQQLSGWGQWSTHRMCGV